MSLSNDQTVSIVAFLLLTNYKCEQKMIYELSELLFILNKYKVRQIDIITNPGEEENDSRYKQLYYFLQSKSNFTACEVAEWLGEEADSKSFKRFMNNFKRRLYNSVLFIDVNQPQFNDLQKAFYNCQQRVAVMHTLRGRGTITSPLEIAKQILPVAQKYEFYDIALDALEVFKSYHAFYTGNEKEYDKYAQLVQSYRHISNAEMLAKEYFQRLQLHSISSSGNGKKIHELSVQFLDKLDSYAETVESTAFIINYGLIKVYKYMSIHHWEATIDICDSILQKLNKKSSVSRVLLNAFLHQKAMSLFMLRRYENANTIIEQSIQRVKEGTFNWFKGMEVQLYIKLHQKHYLECWQTYKKVTRHTQFKNMSNAVTEPWKIYHAYLSFLNTTDKLKLSPREKGNIKKFRMGKFLNELPIFSKDKRGLNIPILIVQVLFLLYEKKYDALEYRFEVLRKYSSKYLKKSDEHIRTDLFIKALQLLVKGDFEYAKSQPLTCPVITQMSEKEISIANQTHEIEVVPYERQWEWILEMLE
jgi:hypothetical protein